MKLRGRPNRPREDSRGACRRLCTAAGRARPPRRRPGAGLRPPPTGSSAARALAALRTRPREVTSSVRMRGSEMASIAARSSSDRSPSLVRASATSCERPPAPVTARVGKLALRVVSRGTGGWSRGGRSVHPRRAARHADDSAGGEDKDSFPGRIHHLIQLLFETVDDPLNFVELRRLHHGRVRHKEKVQDIAEGMAHEGELSVRASWGAHRARIPPPRPSGARGDTCRESRHALALHRRTLGAAQPFVVADRRRGNTYRRSAHATASYSGSSTSTRPTPSRS